jgi:ankyrin repeat protein
MDLNPFTVGSTPGSTLLPSNHLASDSKPFLPGSIGEQLVSASSSGDLLSVQAIYQNWKSAQNPVTMASAEEPNRIMQPALEAATSKNQLEVIAYFLEQGFAITSTVVKNAIKAKSIPALELFLAYGWDINTRWRHYMLPSIWYRINPPHSNPQCSSAISRDNLSIVTWFLDHGASPNLQYNVYMSTTPLTCAVIYASLSMVKLLVARGARVNEGNLLHALGESEVPDRLAILDYLVEQGSPVNELKDAHNPRRFRSFSCHGLDTPLHRAVKFNRIALAEALLAHGADQTKMDTKGRTPLEVAAELGFGEMIKLLEGDAR